MENNKLINAFKYLTPVEKRTVVLSYLITLILLCVSIILLATGGVSVWVLVCVGLVMYFLSLASKTSLKGIRCGIEQVPEGALTPGMVQQAKFLEDLSLSANKGSKTMFKTAGVLTILVIATLLIFYIFISFWLHPIPLPNQSCGGSTLKAKKCLPGYRCDYSQWGQFQCVGCGGVCKPI